MNIERDTVVEIAVSVAAVVLFALAIIAIGGTYYTRTTGFSEQGAIVLVGAIGGFVILMLFVRYFLATR
jgi:hypothetical protein